MRSRHVDEGGELSIRTAQPTRQIDHLGRLLVEHLAKVELQAPVGELRFNRTRIEKGSRIHGGIMPLNWEYSKLNQGI